MTGLLLVIAVILGVQLLLAAAAIVVGLDYSRRAMTVLRALQTHAEMDSNESLPAIRAALSDVVDTLTPPGGAR
jgi:uncharacterized protein YidB (DUF937 family)